jgi:hypothetical protein
MVAADARRVLEGNRQHGISAWAGQRYDFVCPSPTTYPFQWFWDSAFHAIALLHVDPELAKQEIRCLMQGARADGFIPHMLLWEKSAHASAIREYSITLADPFYTATSSRRWSHARSSGSTKQPVTRSSCARSCRRSADSSGG